MKRVVLAPDKFKGTLTALEVTAALERGFARADLEVLSRPMADGGEGTLEVLVAAARRRGETVSIHGARVSGPLGDPVSAEFAMIGRRAVIESARACGLELVPPARRDAVRASSRGLGELARAAAEAGASELWIAVGGSATTDGGAGFARALGARFLDASGNALEEGGGALVDLGRVEPPTVSLPPVVALVDVRSPLLGARGSARLFAPQKGATEDQVALLDRGLARLAYRTRPELASRDGAGAAGGLGFGLLAFAGAELVPGAPRIAEAIGLDEAIEGAALVVTGEGSFDRSTLEGKTARHVLARARAFGVPAAIVAGTADPALILRAKELGVREVVLLEELTGGDGARSRRDAAALVERAATVLRERLLSVGLAGGG